MAGQVLVAGWWIARNAFVETVAVPGTLFETRNGDDAAYQLWHRAVRLLADEHGGPGALRQVCAEVGQGRPWRSACETSFGLTTVAFYDVTNSTAGALTSRAAFPSHGLCFRNRRNGAVSTCALARRPERAAGERRSRCPLLAEAAWSTPR